MKKILLFASFLVGISAQAQYWTEYATSQPAASTGMRSISIVDDNVTWLSMSCGTTGCTTIRRYSKTADGGLTWSTGVVDLGPTSANLEIANIHGSSIDVAYASVFPKAGDPGGVYKTIDGGTTWTKQATASFNDPASFTNLVHFFDANNGVCMGDATGTFPASYFEIYTTTNGGTNWTRVPSSPALVPIDAQDYGLTNQFTTNGDNIWIGTTFGRILHSSDRGVTWTVSQSPIPDFGGGINGDGSGDLAFTDANNGLLQTDTWELYSTADGGDTWAPVAVSADTALKTFGLSDVPGQAGAYVSVGEDLLTSPERGSAFTVDGGVTWFDILDDPDVDGGVIAFRSTTVGFASGFSTSAAVGGIFKWNGIPLVPLANATFSTDGAFIALINKATGMLEVSGKNITNVTVFDVLGKQVSNNNFTSIDNATVNASNFNSGVYLVRVTNNAGAASTVKVVKN